MSRQTFVSFLGLFSALLFTALAAQAFDPNAPIPKGIEVNTTEDAVKITIRTAPMPTWVWYGLAVFCGVMIAAGVYRSDVSFPFCGAIAAVVFVSVRPKDTCIEARPGEIEVLTGRKGKYSTVRKLETARIESINAKVREEIKPLLERKTPYQAALLGGECSLEFVLDEGAYSPMNMTRKSAEWIRGLLLSLMAASS